MTQLVSRVKAPDVASLGGALFGWPPIAGTLCLIAGIVLFTTFGNASVERLFKWVSIFLYGTYLVFLILAVISFGDRIAPSFATPELADGGRFAASPTRATTSSALLWCFRSCVT
jgi:amino acid transporter